MSANHRRYSVDSSSFLEPGELEFAEPSWLVRPPTASKVDRGNMLDPIELGTEDLVPHGPPMSIRLTIQIRPGTEPGGYQQEIVTLLKALDDFDRALGGNGLALDASVSGGTDDTLTVILRPRNVRWSLDRFTQMAELLGVAPGSPMAEEPPAHLNGTHIAAVTALFAQRGPVEKETARDRVQSWRGRQKWLAGLQVELLQRKGD
jgi:hypothetical protein